MSPNLAHLRDIRLRNLSDLDFDLSRSSKVIYEGHSGEGAIGLPLYDFPLMFNSNIGPSWAPLWDIRLKNLSDLDVDLSRSLNVKSNGAITPHIWIPISV